MRILQVIAGSQEGGAEQFFLRLVRALNKKGLSQKAVIRHNQKRANFLENINIPTVQCRFSGKLDFFTRGRIVGQINSYKPDIVLSWMSRAASMCKPKNGAVHCGRLGGYYNLKYYNTCDHLIGNTPDIVDYIIRNGWPEKKAHYLPNFVDTHQGPAIARNKLFTPPGAPVVIALGRFHKNKAFDILLAAIAKLPDVYLWLGGCGPLESDLRRLARNLGVAPRVRFLGWVENPAEYLAGGDLLVCPSRVEPLGNVIIEAWAHNLPVVAAESKGPAQLISDGENGLLCPIDNYEILSHRIYEVLTNTVLAKRLARLGREKYNSAFTEKVVVSKYLNFFEKVL